MTNLLYSKLAGVGHIFYKLYFPHEKIADIIDGYLKKFDCKKIVFFGAFVYVAKLLQERGYGITFVDYTKEMVEEAKKVLRGVKFIVSDMRTLELEEKQDAFVLMGRILTYMYTAKDVLKAFNCFKNNLKDSGIIVVDNYEIGKIDKPSKTSSARYAKICPDEVGTAEVALLGKGDYFNGIIEVKDKNLTIRRISKISRQKNKPAIYKWDCIYEKIKDGKKEAFEDKNHILRAFSKDEMKELVEKSNLKFIGNFPNFEERSFITIAQK